MYKDYDEIVNVKLISSSKASAEFANLAGSEFSDEITNLISYCARVSNPSNQNNLETADNLISYLIKNKHWSPFELVNVCLEITTTRDIARQILRHRSFSFQEFSQRYADPTKELEFCFRECRLQDNKNRQNSIPTEDKLLKSDWYMIQKSMISSAIVNYKYAISKGIAKEVARAILPEGNTVSRMYVNGSIRSWIHYIEVREKNGTQKEHAMVAHKCAQVISEIFPSILKLQEKN